MATVRELLLAAELKRLREAAGVKPDTVATELDIDKSTVHRIERAATIPKDGILLGMLGLYGADSATTAELTQLRVEAKRHQRGWWGAYKDVFNDTTYLGLEDGASTIRTWQNMFIPGLLQTEDYARAVFEGIRPGDPDNQRRVEARAVRRTRFNGRADARLHALLDESVLHRQVGDRDTMRQQVSALRVAATRRPNIAVQIVPLSVGAHPGMVGSFVLLGFHDIDSEFAYVESRAGNLFPEDAPALSGFNIDWGRIHGAALTPEESAAKLADLLEG